MAPEAKPTKDRVFVRTDRMLWAGPLTLAAALLVVLLIRAVAVAALNPSAGFQPLSLTAPIVDTLIFGGAAVFVFFLMGWYSLNPVRDYRRLAWKALLVSFVPDLGLAVQHWFGGGWSEAIALMTMHVAVWAACVTMLPGLAATNPAVREELSGRDREA